MRVFNQLAFAAVLLTISGEGFSLPIGFGTNQGDIQYDERRSDHFTVYHDRRVPNEGAMVINALEAARPHLEQWFAAHRQKPLPVIMSAVSENASFANFLTDAIELQTMGQGGRDLAWHEYTHSTMYRRFDNWFGPAGNILHLPWMPAWFLEGLADAMAVTVTSDGMAGIERYQALSGDWPTYDRLHSLYAKYGFAERGYATSAAFVRYILRRGDPAKLPELLETFYKTSMPWWWPYTLVPYVNSLPMDRALQGFVGMNGEELYEAYKADAKQYWETHGEGPFLLADAGPKKDFTSVRGLRSDGEKIYNTDMRGDKLVEVSLDFAGATGWADGTTGKARRMETKNGTLYGSGAAMDTTLNYLSKGPDTIVTLTMTDRKSKESRAYKRKGYIQGIADGAHSLAWIEIHEERSSLCTAHGAKALNDVKCPLEATMPGSLRHLGNERAPGPKGATIAMWVLDQVEHLTGTKYSVGRYDLKQETYKKDFLVTEARPVSVTFANRDLWILLAERNTRTIRHYDGNGQCTAMLNFKDHITDVLGMQDGSLVLALYAGDHYNVRRIAKPLELAKPCRPEDRNVSPLLAAVASGGAIDLKTALDQSEIWTEPKPKTAAETAAFLATVPLDQAVQPGTHTAAAPEPAKWRPRPLFLFPWIGADDALGPQIGIVSVPLMDEMQNETVRFTFLYGVPSNFPYTEITLDSSRYKADLAATVYRQQTYNGRFIVSTKGEVAESYLDEKGVRFATSISRPWLGGTGSFGAGLKIAALQPYLGPSINGKGTLVEPVANVALGHRVGRLLFTQSLSGRVAPDVLNDDFDYNQIGASTSLGINLPFRESRFSLGLEGSRTRGKAKRDFKEVYRPLKTFIPGSGGGLNQNSYPLSSVGTGLFSPVFGDTQARARADYTMPIIRDVDKMLWIIYLERLDFTAFYNYGDAWNGAEPRRGWEKLIRAHGYNIDLQMENKGVRFNAGLGTGQVIGRAFEVYLTAGFDALF